MGKYEWSIIRADLMKGIYTHFTHTHSQAQETEYYSVVDIGLQLAYSTCDVCVSTETKTVDRWLMNESVTFNHITNIVILLQLE